MDISPQTQAFIREHQTDDVRMLALKAGKYPGVDINFAINQIAGRQAACEKIPLWYAADGIIYPPHLPMEQCSSETTALFKSTLISGNSLADLTGGFGIDCSFLARNFKQVTYIERQKELCEIAYHNFAKLGLPHITIENKDAESYLADMQPVDCIYIDPARRNKQGGKTFLISDCEPNVSELEPLLLNKAHTVLIKLSPMLDLSLAVNSLSSVSEIYVVSVKNDCKELLLILRENYSGEIPIHCVNFTSHEQPQTFTFTRNSEAQATCLYTDEIDRFLYEPNASVLKAGAFKSVAQHYNVRKLHPNSHLYTSPEYIGNFPGKSFRVLQYGSVKDKNIIAGTDKANVATRNFPFSAPELRKQLKIKEGGDTFLYGTTLNNNKKILIKAEKIG